MKIDPRIIAEVNTADGVRQEEPRATVCFRGALRSQARLPGRSERVMPTFRKQWIQTAGFGSSHSE
jgi:hypothetical protein